MIRELISLAAWLSRAFERPPRQHPATTQREEQQNDANLITAAVEQSRDAIVGEYRADREKSKRENSLNRKIAIITLVGVWLYTCVAFVQYRNMQEALKHTKEALRITERAYVNFGFADGKFMRLFPLEVGKPIMVSVHLQNSGRLPATRVVVNYGISRPIKPGMNQTLQPPSYHHVTNCDPRKDDESKHPDWIESIIPANAAETRYLFVPNDKLSSADIGTIKNLGFEIAVMGFVQYCDGFDRVQCMSFCASYKDDARRDFVPCLRGILDYCPAGFGPQEQK